MEVQSVLLRTSANCPLYECVRYWECPLREVVTPHTQKQNVNNKSIT